MLNPLYVVLSLLIIRYIVSLAKFTHKAGEQLEKSERESDKNEW